MAREINFVEIIQTFQSVAEILEQLGIGYHLGGSVASSLHGEARHTQDIDLVAILRPSHVRRFVALLGQDYYLDEGSIRDALRLHSSFNMISFETSMKIDIFIPKPRAFDQDELQHLLYLPLEPGGRVFLVASPESTVLRKLEWYEMDGRVSNRQWHDVLGILRKNADSLDYAYLSHWAKVLRVDDLLCQALQV